MHYKGLFLAAILSDTLDLKATCRTVPGCPHCAWCQSPTSTDMDALMVGVLAKIAGIEARHHRNTL